MGGSDPNQSIAIGEGLFDGEDKGWEAVFNLGRIAATARRRSRSGDRRPSVRTVVNPFGPLGASPTRASGGGDADALVFVLQGPAQGGHCR